MAHFEAGKTYSTRSICDNDCVIKRTPKTITADLGGHRGVKTLRIKDHDGEETVKPWSSYSMAPKIRA